MLRLIGLVISIGLADSLNPSTIAPALYLASGERPREQVSEFTLAVFAVYFLGGAAIALGPGQLLLALIPHPGRRVAHIAEIVAGVTMLVAAAALWRHRDRLAERKAPELDTSSRSGLVLGATITALELPTAFPYFAAIAAIVGSGFGPARQVFLLVLFNVCFVLPLLGIAATLMFAGDRAERLLTVGRNFLERNWPTVLAGLALVAGLFVVTARRDRDRQPDARRLRDLLAPVPAVPAPAPLSRPRYDSPDARTNLRMPASQRSGWAPLIAMCRATASCGRIRNCSARIPAITASATSSGSSTPSASRGAAPTGSSSASSSIGVRTPCGHRHETLMPASAYVIDSHSATATAACLVAE